MACLLCQQWWEEYLRLLHCLGLRVASERKRLLWGLLSGMWLSMSGTARQGSAVACSGAEVELASGERLGCRAVVGADGVKSRVTAMLGLPPVRYAGEVYFRWVMSALQDDGLVPAILQCSCVVACAPSSSVPWSMHLPCIFHCMAGLAL